MACKIYRKLLVNKNPRNGGKPQNNSYIVIHNIGYGTAESCWSWFYKCLHGQGRDGIACQYTIDDKEGYQMLEDNWGAGHTRGDGHYKGFNRDPEGKINNGNAIGIEVGDRNVDIDQAIENAIELTRYLMQCYNIPIQNVVRHGDTQNKYCPEIIMNRGKWDYMLQEIEKRNKANQPINLDVSEHKKADMTSTEGPLNNGTDGNTETGSSPDNSSVDSNFGSTSNSITIIYNDTTTVQESLPNANVSDNWIDMHKIKGITLHMHPPYHNCTADSMAKYFESLGWDRNFHYKVDKDTKIDFDKKPVSGQTTGGNLVGTSVSDFEITPKDPLNQTVVITGENVTISNANGSGPITTPGNSDNTDGSTDSGGSEPGDTVSGDGVPEKIYNYCVAQGCSTAAACGIIGNAERESTSNFDPTIVNEIGCSGLFQWKDERLDALKKKASAAGKKWTDVDIQIQFMWEEWSGPYYTRDLKRKYGKTLAQFKQMTDPKEAARVFEAVFEVSGDTTDLRAKYAQKWYDKFSKMGGTATSYMAFDDTPAMFSTFSNRTKSDAISAYTDNYMVYYADEEDDTIEQIKEPFGWPAPTQTYVQSYFGYRSDSLGYKYHPGIDIANYAGTGAYCYADGVVKKVLKDTKVNGYVRIDHGYGIQTVYGSLNEIKVKEGDTVEGGQCIGTTGTTVSNPLMHLHFEMLKDGKHVDPLNYIEPGGGYTINPFPQPEILSVYGLMRASNYGIASYASISNTSDKDSITWDTVDKGKICFASADNNTHTYIDANLFNNQHPKYTLSIGAFFYDEFDLVEKTGNVNYPETEKKLIEQCAKALYDEGFTSKQLWREFDLNRAPSPFLYLDKDKWIDFCDEVDKQVKWLNKKYGKVTSTYIPNNLLTNQNTNNFIETAPLPDGVIVPGNNGNAPGNAGGGPANVSGALFIGDSWGVGIEPLVEAEGGISEASGGKDFLYFYNPSKKIDRLKKMKKDPTFIYVYLGLNNLKTNSKNAYVDKFYQRIKEIWPHTHVYVGKLMHVAKTYKPGEYKNVDEYNKALDELNGRIEILCSANGFTFIDVSSGLIDSDGYLSESLATSDGLHLKNWQTYYDNIKNAIGKYENPSTDNGGNTGSGDFVWPVPGHSRISSPFGPRRAPTVGASTYHRGIDIPASTGTPVIASDSGKVVVAKTGYNGGRGTYVVIDHGNGMGTLYQHLNKYFVKVGQSVNRSDKIAEVGDTGIGTASHLHFEVQTSFSGTKGTPVNPEKYVSPKGKKSEAKASSSSSSKSATASTFSLRAARDIPTSTLDNTNNTEEVKKIYPTVKPGLFIGDNWEYNMRNLIEGEDNESNYYFYGSEEDCSICEAAISKDASYYYNPSKNIDRLEGMEKDVSFVYIHLGYNRLKDNLESNDTIRFLNKVKELYSNVPVYVAKLPHCGRRYEGQDYKSADAFNEAVDKYNDKVKSYCIKNNFYFIDISKNLVDDEGYLKDSIVELDGITLNEYVQYYNNIKNIIKSTSSVSIASIYDDYGDANMDLTEAIDNNSEARVTARFTARATNTENNKDSKQYCYVGNTAGTTMYKNAKTSSSKVATLAVGDELEITGSKNTFYKCTFNKKKGYVSKDDVVDIGNNHGKVFQDYVGQTCWIKYENTDYYKNTKLTEQHKDLKEQTKAVIIGTDTELGIYKIKTNDTSGYVKGYAVTFDESEFKTSTKDPGNDVIEPETSDEDKNTSGNLDTVSLKNADFEEEDLSMWNKMGSVELERITNPEWGTPEHWPYRKNGFARIKNPDGKKMSGISQEFDLSEVGKENEESKENEDNKDNKKNKKNKDNKKNKKNKKPDCWLRVLFMLKPVTSKDTSDAPIDPDALKENKIFIKLLKGEKVKYEKEIDISDISNTIWSRVGCIFTELDDSAYSLFIGSKEKYDLYIDDITIEKIYKDNIDQLIGDTNSSSGITLSGLGTTSIDNGGVMVYKVGKPSDSGASQPKIKTIITQEEYEEIMQYATAANIDLYTNSFEPYDKDLVDAKTVGLTNDIRESLLPEQIRTFTDNIIRYKVVETGPGSVDHCVKPVDELSVLLKNTECKVDPIYPDLVIPPKYVTSKYDTVSKNSIPMTTIENATASMEDTLDKSFSYDYKLLDKKTKKSIGSPVNYYDPYCYDDKITDLENHYPKVLIDEIESRLYSCNHPGCPIAHPMAKNFAMLNDMAINQSKVTEQRLVRLENTLATMVRYLGRMASRVNINCVYYGGQTVLGKYKCIRCLRDDRVHDGATVTMDQCLTCTRYEPIIGQVYDILDETGFNGSAILDDMQMSYMSLDDFKNLNDVEKRSTVYNYVNTNKKEKNKPKSLIDEWQERDKKAKLGKDAKEEELNKLKPSDYLFMMDWTEDSVDLQQPDVKVYPTEKIAAKYYNQAGDPGEEDTASAEKSVQIGVSDKVYDTIASGEWVDTREKDDSVQINRYTSLDFYFERFNMNRTGYEYDNGIKGNIGLISTSGGSYNGNNGDIGNSINGTGSELRKKITEMAKTIYQECKDGKAWYSGEVRTIDHDKPQKMSDGRTAYDCTSLVSCCYKAAGLSDFYDGRTGQGVVANNTLAQEVLKKGGEIWFADKEGMAKALPGDVLMTYKYDKINKDHLKDGIDCRATHAIIYMGDGMIIHASSPKAGIKYEKADYYITGKKAGHSYFLRPKSLVDADKAAANNGGTGPDEVAGTIDGMNYVCKLGKARCTEYGTWDNSEAKVSSGKPWSQCLNKTVASHNLPFGTKIYIPGLKGKVNSTGLFTVEDTGGYTFDFDVCTSTSFNITGFYEAYIISYGTDKRIAASFTYGRKATGGRFEKAFREYMKYGGCLIKFNKFDSEDANASWWKK